MSNQNQMLMNSRSGQTNFNSNDFFLKPKYASKTFISRLDSKGKTIVRPVPAVDASGAISPFRTSNDLSDFGGWFAMAHVVRFFGRNKFSFAIDIDSKLRSPAIILYNAHYNAERNSDRVPRIGEWLAEVKGRGGNDYGILRRPDDMMFVPAVILQRGQTIPSSFYGMEMDHARLPVVGLSRSAYVSMTDHYMNPEQAPGSIPDPINLDGGSFWSFSMPGSGAGQQGGAPGYGGTGSQGGFSSRNRRSTQESNSYVCEVSDTVQVGANTYSAGDLGRYFRDHFQSRMFDVTDIIDPLSPERQMEMILRTGFPSALLQHAFQSTEWWDYIPESIRNEGFRPTHHMTGYAPVAPAAPTYAPAPVYAPPAHQVPQSPPAAPVQYGLTSPHVTSWAAATPQPGPAQATFVSGSPAPAPQAPVSYRGEGPNPAGLRQSTRIPQFDEAAQARLAASTAQAMAIYDAMDAPDAPISTQPPASPLPPGVVTNPGQQPVPNAHAGLAAHAVGGVPLTPPQGDYFPPVQVPGQPLQQAQPGMQTMNPSQVQEVSDTQKLIMGARRRLENPGQGQPQ